MGRLRKREGREGWCQKNYIEQGGQSDSILLLCPLCLFRFLLGDFLREQGTQILPNKKNPFVVVVVVVVPVTLEDSPTKTSGYEPPQKKHSVEFREVSCDYHGNMKKYFFLTMKTTHPQAS